MIDFLSEFEVVSDLTLPEGCDEIEFAPRCGRFRATISHAAADASSARLLMRLYSSAESFEEAEQTVKGFAGELLETLTVAAGARFERPSLRRIVEWSANLPRRRACLYLELGELGNPQSVLDQRLADTVSELLRDDVKPPLRTAIGWYRDGLLGTTPDRKVQAFWLCLETLVGD